MANSLIQLRVDENLRLEAVEIFDKLGIDLPTAIRMFLVRSVLEKGIPFPMKLEDDSITRNAIFAMKEASRLAKEHGISEMTLEEINAEISDARK